jgi:hypothetical protein
LNKDVTLFSNYEADQLYFPTRWGQAPREDPDYVVAFGTANAPQRVMQFLDRYEIVHATTNLALLRRRPVPPDMKPWTVLPDGRRALRLGFAADNVPQPASVRPVARERFFSSGSFGWVRVAPRRDWRSERSGREKLDFPRLVGDERDRTFRIDLPDGRYDVTLHFATNPAGAYETCVIANDTRIGRATVPDRGEPQTLRYTVDVTNGQLTQTFYTTWPGSTDPRRLRYWAVSGIEIVSTHTVGPTTSQATKP